MKKSILFFTMLFLSGMAMAQVDLSNGLIAYYPFNGNANDESTNSYNGTVTNATLTTDRFGNASKAYKFTSTSSIGSTVPAAMSSFSVAVWFNGNQTGNQSLFNWIGSNLLPPPMTESTSIAMTLLDPTSTATTVRYNMSQGTACTRTNTGGNTVSYLDSTWHLAIVSVSSGVLLVYVDGVVIDSSATVVGCSSLPLQLFTLGSSVNSIKGSVDDVMLYNRKLTPEERDSIYNLSAPFTLTPSGLANLESNALQVALYPNPSKGTFNLDLPNLSNSYQVQVFNTNGQVVLTRNNLTAGVETLDIQHLSAGMYLVQVRDEKGAMSTQKLVKE